MTEEEMNNNGAIIVIIIFIIVSLMLIGWAVYSEMGITCKINILGNRIFGSKELVCEKSIQYNMWGETNKWGVINQTQKAIDIVNEKKQRDDWQVEQTRIALENKRCYNAGKSYNFSFDIINDYGFSCNKLAYINDHFIDNTKKLSSGYVEGDYYGFASYGSIHGESYQYVTEKILATGSLIKNMSYHLDCKNQTSEETVNYYTEGDAIMYYVNKCIL